MKALPEVLGCRGFGQGGRGREEEALELVGLGRCALARVQVESHFK